MAFLLDVFDERLEVADVHRIHHEDFCQALGLGYALKYERNGVAGCALVSIFLILTTCPSIDLERQERP
jgi:hypothetical protein